MKKDPLGEKNECSSPTGPSFIFNNVYAEIK